MRLRLTLYLPTLCAGAALLTIFTESMPLVFPFTASAIAAAVAIVLSGRPIAATQLARISAVVAAGLLLGVLARGGYNLASSGPILVEGEVSVSGRIAARPVVHPDGRGRVGIAAKRLRYSDRTIYIDREITLVADNRLSRLAPGEVIEAAGTLRCSAPAEPMTARCSEYRLYLRGNEVRQLGAATGAPVVGNRLHAALGDGMRRAGDPVAGRGFDRDRAALMWALMLGDRAYLSERSADAYREAGVVHTLALSGMHLGVIAGLAALLFSRLIGRRRALLLSLIIAVSYVLVVGLRPSLLRALLMYGVGVAAFLSGRRILPINALAFASLVTIVGWPSYPHTLSFQLSFLSLFGMFALGVPLGGRLARRVPPFAAYALSASIAAVGATAPLLLSVFGEIHPIGIAASLIVGPLITLFLGYAILHTIVALFGVGVLDSALAAIGTGLYRALDGLVVAASGAPAASGGAGWFVCGVLLATSLVSIAWPRAPSAAARAAFGEAAT